jgi:Vitamin B12 dependent methionine synthase, activation domain.
MSSDALILPFEISLEQLVMKLHLKEGSPYLDRVLELVSEAKTVAKPKAAYKDSYVEFRDRDSVIIDGIKFKSRILQVNLENVHRVFPFVVTCGQELDMWSKGITDFFENFCAETIKDMILHSASENFKSLIDRKFGLDSASNMNPGSLADWPIYEQMPLFQLLGNVKELIDVELTESFLLVPMKSISGIRFPKEGTYENCQLCPNEKCPNRKAPYNPLLYQEKYQ